MTDLVMPRMNGRQLATRLAEERPQIGIVFMSGYNDEAALGEPTLGASDAFIQKPFSPIGLARKVREMLDVDDR